MFDHLNLKFNVMHTKVTKKLNNLLQFDKCMWANGLIQIENRNGVPDDIGQFQLSTVSHETEIFTRYHKYFPSKKGGKNTSS